MPASHYNDVDDDVDDNDVDDGDDDNDVDDGDLMSRNILEQMMKLQQDFKMQMKKQEQVPIIIKNICFSFHRPCLETHKKFSWLLLSFENRDNVLPEAFMTSRKFIIVFVLTILRKEVVGLGGL